MGYCQVETTGPQHLRCQRIEGHDGGHLWVAGDVDDRHTEGVDEQ